MSTTVTFLCNYTMLILTLKLVISRATRSLITILFPIFRELVLKKFEWQFLEEIIRTEQDLLVSLYRMKLTIDGAK